MTEWELRMDSKLSVILWNSFSFETQPCYQSTSQWLYEGRIECAILMSMWTSCDFSMSKHHCLVWIFFSFQLQFRHELYPSHTTQAARQVLLINDIEVRDKLAESQINKFLYQYSSLKIPKRSNASMVSYQLFLCIGFIFDDYENIGFNSPLSNIAASFRFVLSLIFVIASNEALLIFWWYVWFSTISSV